MTIWSHRTSVMFAYQSMCCVIMCHYQDIANNLYCSLIRSIMVFLTHNEEYKEEDRSYIVYKYVYEKL